MAKAWIDRVLIMQAQRLCVCGWDIVVAVITFAIYTFTTAPMGSFWFLPVYHVHFCVQMNG